MVLVVGRLEEVPGALIITTHHHTLSLGRDDSHLPTQTRQPAAGCWEPQHAAAFTLIIPVSAVLALWHWNISPLKIDNMCFYILKLLGRISFIVVNIVGKLLIKIPE